jgi:hypothetical protein
MSLALLTTLASNLKFLSLHQLKLNKGKAKIIGRSMMNITQITHNTNNLTISRKMNKLSKKLKSHRLTRMLG